MIVNDRLRGTIQKESIINAINPSSPQSLFDSSASGKQDFDLSILRVDMYRCSDSSTGRKYKQSMTYHFRPMCIRINQLVQTAHCRRVAIKKIGNAKRRIYTLHSRSIYIYYTQPLFISRFFSNFYNPVKIYFIVNI